MANTGYSVKPTSSVREKDIDALLKRVRALEEEVETNNKIINVAKNCMTYLQEKTESTIRDVDDIKVQVLQFRSATPAASAPRSPSSTPRSTPRSSPEYESSFQDMSSPSPTFRGRLRYSPTSSPNSSPPMSPQFQPNSPVSFNGSPDSEMPA